MEEELSNFESVCPKKLMGLIVHLDINTLEKKAVDAYNDIVDRLAEDVHQAGLVGC